jgi:transmembrane sensor
MSEESKYSLPDFIVKEMSVDGPLSENDIRLIGNIYNAGETYKYPESNVALNWSRIEDKIKRSENGSNLNIIKKPVYKYYAKWAIAAVLLVSLTFGVIKFNLESNDFEPMAMSTTGAIKKMTLPDGSIAVLNTFSTLSTNDFDSDERIITLSGEAYFEVKHNKQAFIVKTGNKEVKVLGTKFNVRNRKQMPFQVALSSGSISLSTNRGIYKLSPGELLTETKNNTFIKSKIGQRTPGWIDEKLVFENETLSDIIIALENQYHVTFDYDTSLKSEKLTLTFNKLNAQQAAELLSMTLNSKVVVK